MLNKAKTLTGYKLNSRDGEIGKVKEFYFDDHFWTIRYLVADTGDWLTGRQVLISPYALGFVNKGEQTIVVVSALQIAQVRPPRTSWSRPASNRVLLHPGDIAVHPALHELPAGH